MIRCSIEESLVKEISKEIRASKDIRKFATTSNPLIILDCTAESEVEILTAVIQELDDRGDIQDEQTRSAILNAMLTQHKEGQFKNILRSKSDSDWIVPVGEVSELKDRIIAFVRLKSSLNLENQTGGGFEQLLFFIITPSQLSPLQRAEETGKSFAALLQDDQLRFELLTCKTSGEVQQTILTALEGWDSKYENNHKRSEPPTLKCSKIPCRGLCEDVGGRIGWYLSDFIDGVRGLRSMGKTLSTIFFLYFACILPAIAFGVLNEHQTHGNIDVKKMIWSQALGGIVFSLIGGQPLVILLSTAPLALYMKIVYEIASSSNMEFFGLFAWVGISNGVFLVIYAIINASGLMKYCSRFTEETFGFFISIAFAYDALRPLVENFIAKFYFCDELDDDKSSSRSEDICNREESLLFVILLFGTLLVGYWLWSFNSSRLLSRTLREKISDYSLPLAVGIMTFFGSLVFRPTNDEQFPYVSQSAFHITSLFSVPVWGAFVGIALGFILSLLFLIDQNISALMVNAPANHLKKPHAYHMDLYVIGMISIALSLLGLPWIHGALPHSPLHVRALADTEIIYHQGAIEQRIIRVRETRLPALIAHIMIGFSIFMVPNPLQEIPVPVLYGVFLYLSVTALPGNTFWQRLKLILTERKHYSPNSFVRRVPARVIHMFTFVQIICVLWLCVFGFTPVDYVQMLLPIAIISLVPFRKLVINRLFQQKYLQVLDPL